MESKAKYLDINANDEERVEDLLRRFLISQSIFFLSFLWLLCY